MKNNKSVAFACYLGNLTQAIIINLIPILFIPLKEIYGFSLTDLGLLTLVNFLAQIFSDLLFGSVAGKVGFKKICLSACLLAIFGFLIFILAPLISKNKIFIIILIGTAMFSIAGGMLEVVLSPIISLLMENQKCKSLSLLHSFTAWGQASVVLITTLLVYFLKAENWQIIASVWLIFPIICLILFSAIKLNVPYKSEETTPIKNSVKNPIFILIFIIILIGGALEQIISQLGSAYLESGLNIPKILGDSLGICGFAIMLGIGRLLFSKYCVKYNTVKLMLFGITLSFCGVIVIALSPSVILTVCACMLIGLSVSIIVPGSISFTNDKFPTTGICIFGFLYFANDLGAAIGPMLTSLISDNLETVDGVIKLAENINLTPMQLSFRIGMLCASIFPLIGFTALFLLNKKENKNEIHIPDSTK